MRKSKLCLTRTPTEKNNHDPFLILMLCQRSPAVFLFATFPASCDFRPGNLFGSEELTTFSECPRSYTNVSEQVISDFMQDFRSLWAVEPFLSGARTPAEDPLRPLIRQEILRRLDPLSSYKRCQNEPKAIDYEGELRKIFLLLRKKMPMKH